MRASELLISYGPAQQAQLLPSNTKQRIIAAKYLLASFCKYNWATACRVPVSRYVTDTSAPRGSRAACKVTADSHTYLAVIA